jgi:hypothetical protein
MQRVLRVVRFLDRVDFGAQVIRAQEVVGDPQPAGCVPF